MRIRREYENMTTCDEDMDAMFDGGDVSAEGWRPGRQSVANERGAKSLRRAEPRVPEPT